LNFKTQNNHWNNEKNSNIFEKLPIVFFKKTAKKIGLDKCCDIQNLEIYINKSDSILDVGAGWGRVLNYLIFHKKYKGKLYALERSQQFYSYLKREFANQVELYNEDIRTFSSHNKVDLILWMWAGIAEFNQQEQKQVIIRLASILCEGGYLIIETNPNMEAIPEANLHTHKLEGQHGIVQVPSSKILYYYFMPTTEQIKEYAASAKLKHQKSIHYKTDTGLERTLDILQK
jgi:cyclopropane fatty-acyl-phospholipid synthase-like methyltransferase